MREIIHYTYWRLKGHNNQLNLSHRSCVSHQQNTFSTWQAVGLERGCSPLHLVSHFNRIFVSSQTFSKIVAFYLLYLSLHTLFISLGKPVVVLKYSLWPFVGCFSASASSFQSRGIFPHLFSVPKLYWIYTCTESFPRALWNDWKCCYTTKDQSGTQLLFDTILTQVCKATHHLTLTFHCYPC